MSFPPALKSMYTRGFSARVAKPRIAEAPSLAETQASFVAASIVEKMDEVLLKGRNRGYCCDRFWGEKSVSGKGGE